MKTFCLGAKFSGSEADEKIVYYSRTKGKITPKSRNFLQKANKSSHLFEKFWIFSIPTF